MSPRQAQRPIRSSSGTALRYPSVECRHLARGQPRRCPTRSSPTPVSSWTDSRSEQLLAFHVLVKGGSIHTVSPRPLDRGERDGRRRRWANPSCPASSTFSTVTSRAPCLSPKNVASAASEIAEAAASYLRSSLMDGFTDDPRGRWRRLLDRPPPRGRGDRRPAAILFGAGADPDGRRGGLSHARRDQRSLRSRRAPISVMSVIVDGVDEVRRAAARGAATGSDRRSSSSPPAAWCSPRNPMPRSTSSRTPSCAAAVEEAAARGTYVMAHVYTDEGVWRCLRAGVRSIEHANFVSQGTVAMMAEHRRLLRPDVHLARPAHRERGRRRICADRIVSNLRQTVARGQDVYAWAKQHDVPIAFGTDLWGPEAQRSQVREFEMRVGLDSPARIIRSATATNAELLMQEGKLGRHCSRRLRGPAGGGRRSPRRSAAS